MKKDWKRYQRIPKFLRIQIIFLLPWNSQEQGLLLIDPVLYTRLLQLLWHLPMHPWQPLCPVAYPLWGRYFLFQWIYRISGWHGLRVQNVPCCHHRSHRQQSKMICLIFPAWAMLLPGGFPWEFPGCIGFYRVFPEQHEESILSNGWICFCES